MTSSTRTCGRRPSGDGSLYSTNDGRWRAVVDLGGVDGKRRRKYVSGATQSQALKRLRQAQRELDHGSVSDDRLTVGQFLSRWATQEPCGTSVGHNAR